MNQKQWVLAVIITTSLFVTACQNINPLLENAKNIVFTNQNSVTSNHQKAINHPAATTVVNGANATDQKNIALDVDTIIKTAYPQTLTTAMAYVEPQLEDYFQAYPQRQLAENTLGFIHPSIEYKNSQGEVRYLVIVEKVQMYDGYIQSCRACSSTMDILIYKKQGQSFTLINSGRDQTEIPTGNGHLKIGYMQELKQNLQAFGQNLMGSYQQSSSTGAGGQESSSWYAVLLPETGKIQAVYLESAGGSTANYYADEDLGSSTTSTLKVITNQSKYYPIEITYIDNGDKNNPYKSRLNYVESKQAYVEQKIK